MTDSKKLAADSDLSIARRIKSLRGGLCWSQAHFAKALNITRDTLANIESGRTPLRYDLAWLIAQKFDYPIGQIAYDDALDAVHFSSNFPPPYSSEIPRLALLKEIAAAVKKGEVPRPLFIGPNTIPRRDRGSRLHYAWSSLTALIWQCVTETPEERLGEMDHEISTAAESFLKSISRPEREKSGERARALNMAILRYKNIALPQFVKSDIDNPQRLADNPLVSLTWKELKRRLKLVTRERGKKAAAADFAKVDRSNMNRWLDDDQEPGAEAAFRLLAWVLIEEAKQKGDDMVAPVPSPKTQAKGSKSNANIKRPSPRKS